jgi:hypothetical protein
VVRAKKAQRIPKAAENAEKARLNWEHETDDVYASGARAASFACSACWHRGGNTRAPEIDPSELGWMGATSVPPRRSQAIGARRNGNKNVRLTPSLITMDYLVVLLAAAFIATFAVIVGRAVFRSK